MAMTLRMSEEQRSALQETARREGRSMHETVLIALDEYTSRRERNVADLIASILDEDREALERLGSV